MERRKYSRKQRIAKQTILIICEGKKTEPLYFEHYRQLIHSMPNIYKNVVICSARGGNNAKVIVQRAIDEAAKYDKLDLNSVWCVLDVDSSDNKILTEVETLSCKHDIRLILSNPSFEIWYLLHFAYTTRLFTNTQLKEELEKYIPDYDKAKDYYELLIDKENTAINNAKKLKKHHKEQSTSLHSKGSNPSTQVYELVEFLCKEVQSSK